MSIGRIARNIGHLIFNPKYGDKVTSTIKAARRLNVQKGLKKNNSIFSHIGEGFVRADKATAKTPLWKSMKNSITSLPKDMKSMWKNTAGAWGKTKGVFKVLGKRMPVIGGALMVAFELPNILSAFKDKGLVGGVLEIGKSAVRLTGFMGGMAIGTAFGGIIGGLAGGFVGDWLVSRIVGKSHSEEKAEAEEMAMAQQAQLQAMMQQNPQYAQAFTGNPYASQPQTSIPQTTVTPQELAMMQQQLYGGTNSLSDDFMANASGINRLNLMG